MLENTTGVILSGGKASRMGGEDKGLTLIDGQPLIAYVVESMKPQVATIVISANRNLDHYRTYGYDVITDGADRFDGPLSGILSTMHHVKTEYILSSPCDSPFLPENYADRMYSALMNDSATVSVAHNGDSIQPVFLLASCSLASSLDEYIQAGNRKAADWIIQQNPTIVDFSDCPNSFFNMNSPEDKIQLESLISATSKNRC